MKTLNLNPKEGEPLVVLDKSNNVFRISGNSYPHDAYDFYQPVIEWFEQYFSNPNQETEIDFILEYFNTASSKVFLDMFIKFNEYHESGYNVKVKWHYPANDEDIEEAGREYAEMSEVPFDFICLQ